MIDLMLRTERSEGDFFPIPTMVVDGVEVPEVTIMTSARFKPGVKSRTIAIVDNDPTCLLKALSILCPKYLAYSFVGVLVGRGCPASQVVDAIAQYASAAIFDGGEYADKNCPICNAVIERMELLALRGIPSRKTDADRPLDQCPLDLSMEVEALLAEQMGVLA